MKQRKGLSFIFILTLVAITFFSAACGTKKDQTAGKTSQEAAPQDLVQDVKNLEIAEAYCCDLTVYGEDNTSIWTCFDTETKEFVNKVGEDVAMQGQYTVNGNEITTTAADEDGNELASIKYILDGRYLLIEDGMYDGEIPDGDTFEAAAEKTDGSGMLIRYTFQEDGTYTCLEIPSGKTEEEGIVLEGTYKRSGNVIERTLSGNEMIPFYVYSGHLFPSYYEETEMPAED